MTNILRLILSGALLINLMNILQFSLQNMIDSNKIVILTIFNQFIILNQILFTMYIFKSEAFL